MGRLRHALNGAMGMTALVAALGVAMPWTAAQAQAPALSYSQPLAPPAVMQIQDRLRQLGAYTGRVDGVWGPDSQQALERFQQSRGLQVSGQLNQATAATLGLEPGVLLTAREVAPPAAAAAADVVAAADPLGPTAVRRVQRRLRALGFYRGETDGLWGPATQQALQRFQQGRGLQPSGQLNPATVQALGLDAAILVPAAR